jgi:hypothetical protein
MRNEKDSCEKIIGNGQKRFWPNREYVKWLRGDTIQEAVDIYYHIDPEDVRKSYMAHIPQQGV